MLNPESFNSSVGILFVRTSPDVAHILVAGTFQFLGRNSGRSDRCRLDLTTISNARVSIPRSEFWSFGPE